MYQYKRRRSHLDLSEEDIRKLPLEVQAWLDPNYLAKRMEFDDLGNRRFTLSQFRKGSLGEIIEREKEGCIDPLSGVSFNGWDNKVASVFSRY